MAEAGVAWRGIAWRGVALRGVAWRGRPGQARARPASTAQHGGKRIAAVMGGFLRLAVFEHGGVARLPGIHITLGRSRWASQPYCSTPAASSVTSSRVPAVQSVLECPFTGYHLAHLRRPVASSATSREQLERQAMDLMDTEKRASCPAPSSSPGLPHMPATVVTMPARTAAGCGRGRLLLGS